MAGLSFRTQVELSDATGLTPVHVNRILQRLRWEKLIELTRTTVTIKNLEVLQAISQFDPGYLHMGRRGDQPSGGTVGRSF